MLCVVEDIRDVLAIESTQQFKGRYHVLGGRISPMDGIGPQDLTLAQLNDRLKTNSAIKEVILALQRHTGRRYHQLLRISYVRYP